MSATTVDSRVVQFSFDNSKFESNVKTSLSTIEKLKDSLNFDDALKGFDDIDKASKSVSMSGLGDALDTMHAKFSALQVMGVTALANITNSVVNLGKKILSNIVGPITQGGWNRALNIENAKFQLEGLNVAWSEIEDDINHGVRDTAYGLDSAAKVAAQLVASQVQLGDDMKAALRGISGVASMTNSTYDDIGRIFTTVAGNGRLMGDQLLQLSTRGLNAASVLGDALGHTEAEIRQMVSKGEIDFNTFAKAMDDAFGEHAKDANNTFTGAMSNVKAALARIGANFATPIMKAGTDVFNAIRVTVNKINAALQPVYDMASEGIEKVRKFLVDMFDSSTPIERFQNKVKDIGITWDDFQKKVVTTANKDVFGFEQLDSRVENFEDGIKRGLITSETFVEVLNSMIGPMKESQEAIDNVTISYSEFHDIVQKVIRGDFGTGAQRMQALANAGYDAALIQNLANQELEGSALTLETINEETLANVGYTEEQIAKLIELRDAVRDGTISIEEMIEAMNRPTKIQLGVKIFTNLLTAAKGIIDSVGNAWSRAFGENKNTDSFYNLLAALEKFTSKLILTEEKAEKLTKTFEGFFAILDLIGTIVETVFNEAFRVLAAVLGDVNINVLDTTSSIGELLVGFRDWADESQVIQKGVGKLADGIIKMVETVKDWVEKFKEIPFIKGVIDDINTRAAKLVETLKDWFSTNTDLNTISTKLQESLEKVKTKIKEWFDAFKNLPLVKETTEKLSEFAKTVGDTLRNAFDKVSEQVKTFWNGLDPITIEEIKTRFKNFGETLSKAFQNPKDAVYKFIARIKEVKDKVTKWLDEIDFDFDSFVKKVGTAFKNLGEGFKKNIGAIVLMVTGGTLAFGLKKIYDILLGISNLSPLKPLNTATTALNNFAVAQKRRAIGEAFMMVASGVAKLVAAVSVLALLPNADKGIKYLIILGSAFTGMVAVLTEVSKGSNALFTATGGKLGGTFEATLNQATIMMTAMAMSVYIIAKALQQFASIDPNDLKDKIGLMIGIVATLFGTILLSGLGNKIAGTGGNGAGVALTVVSFAASIWLIVHALEDLSKVPYDKLWNTIGAISTLLAVLGVVTGISNATTGLGTGKFSQVTKIFGAGNNSTTLTQASNSPVGTILAMAVAIEVIAHVIQKLAKLDSADIWKGIGFVSLFFAELVGIMAATRLAGTESLKAGVGILAVSGAIFILTGVVRLVAGMETSDLVKGIAVILALGIILGGLIAVTQLTGKYGGGKYAARAGLEMLAISAAIMILVGCVWALANLDQTRMWSAVGAVSLLTIVLGLVIGMSAMFGSDIKIGPIVALAAIMAGLAIVVSIMEKLGIVNALNNATALSEMMLSLGITMYLLSKSEFKEGQLKKTLGAMAILPLILAELAGVLWLLQALKINAAKKNVDALVELLGAITVSILILSHAKEFKKGQLKKVLAGMAVLGLVMAELAGVLALLELMDVDANTKTVTALVVLLEAMSGALLIISHAEFKNWNEWAQAVSGMAALGAILAEISLVLLMLQKMKISASMDNVLALTVLLEAMAGALVILSYEKFTSWSGWAQAELGMVALGLVLAELALVLKLLTELDIDVSMVTIDALCKLLEALGVAMVLLEVAGLGGPAAIIGVGSLEAFIISMAALFAAFAGLNALIPDLQTFLSTGIDVVVQIADGVGRIIGAVTGGFMEQSSASLPDVADNISKFGENLKPFLEVCKTISAEDLEGVTKVASIPLILSSSDFINAITKLLGGQQTSFTEFGKEFVSLAKYLRIFLDKLGGVNTYVLANAIECVAGLAQLAAALPRTGGKIGEWFGDKDWSGFGSGIESFGDGMSKFYAAIMKNGGLDQRIVDYALRCGQALANIETSLRSHEGVFQLWTGDNNLKTFSGQLEEFGKGVTKFQRALPQEGLRIDLVQDATRSGEMLAALENSLRGHGGVFQIFTGEADLTTFGNELKLFAVGIRGFAHELQGENFDTGVIQNVSNIGQMMAKLEENLNSHDGLIQKIIGDQTLSQFGSTLDTFATDFKSFSDTISGISATDFSAMANMVTTLKDIIDTDKYITDSVNAGATYGQNFEDLGVWLNTFSPYFTSWYDTIKGMFFTKLANANTELASLITTFETIDSDTERKVSGFGSSLKDFAENGLKVFAEAFSSTDTGTNVIEAANSFVAGFCSALLSETNLINVKGAAYRLVGTVSSAVKDGSSDIEAIGKEFTSSMATGMGNAAPKITSAISTIMKTVATNFELAYNVNMSGIGETLITSFSTGITKRTSDVVYAFSTMMKNIKDVLTANLSTVASLGESVASSFATPINNVLTTTGGEVGGFYSQFYTVGRELCEGLIAGIQSKEVQVARAARLVGMTLISELRKVLDEHSPSREAIEIGEYFDRGLAEGLDKGNTLVSRTITTVGDGIITGFSSVMSKVAKALDAGIEINPTITPVLDLGEIQNGVDSMNYMLGNGDYSINGAVDFATMAQQGFNAQLDENNQITMAILDLKKTMEAMQAPSNVYNNTFNISGDDPQSIADQVSSIFQHDIDRGGAVWA